MWQLDTRLPAWLSSSGWRPAVVGGTKMLCQSDKVSHEQFRAETSFLCHMNMDQPQEKKCTSNCANRARAARRASALSMRKSHF
jgi:hypothetical protein